MKDDRETIDFLRKIARLDLADSLREKPVIKEYELTNGKTIHLRVGERQDAHNICKSDWMFYGATLTANEDDIIRIASFSDSPLEPVGFYIIRHYPNYNSLAEISDKTCKKPLVGEVFFLYVPKPYRLQKLGSVLTAISALDIINEPDVDLLRFQTENGVSNHILQKMGFNAKRKDFEGYYDYMISLNPGQREVVKRFFQSSLDPFLAGGKDDASNNLPYQAGLPGFCYPYIDKASQSQFCCAP
jgi:hypothetical protein